MSSIDRRIIDMEFNNSRFERNIRQSLTSLDRLRSGLNLNQATQNLSNLSNVANKFSLASIANGVSSISSKFSALGVAGVTALANITNKAIDAGIRITKALTIDPIMEGYREMNTKFSSIGTILANTEDQGTTRQQVADSLEVLNEYADKTIYNFAQMTSNIGKFTAAGVGLQDSVDAVKGMGNIAAVFGANAEQMTGATYQMSQALAAGTIRLQDWRSMEQNSMGGKILQKELIKTAESMGKVVDKNKAFRETLREGWLTSTVFIETMKRISEDETMLKKAQAVGSFSKMMETLSETVSSGWAQTFELIIGNSDQAKDVFTGIAQTVMGVLGPLNDARNAAAKFWSEQGGRQATIDGFVNIFKALKRVITPVVEAFNLIFPNANQTTGLIALSETFRDFTAKLMISKSTMEQIKRTFAGLFAVIDIIKMAVSGLSTIVGTVFQTILKRIFPLDTGLLGVTGSLGSLLVCLRDFIRDNKLFEASFETLGTIISVTTKVIDTALNILPVTIDILKKAFFILVGVIYVASQKIYNAGLDKFIARLQKCITDFSDIIKPKLEAVKNVFLFAFSKIIDIVDKFKKGEICVEFKSIKTHLKDLYDFASPALTALAGVFVLAFDKIVNAINKLKKSGGQFEFKSIKIYLKDLYEFASPALTVLAGAFLFAFGKIVDVINNVKKTGIPFLFSMIGKAVNSMYEASIPVLNAIGKGFMVFIGVIASAFTKLKSILSNAIPEMPDFSNIFSGFIKGFNEFLPLSKILGGIIMGIVVVLKVGVNILRTIGRAFISVISNLFKQIGNVFTDGNLEAMGEAAGGVAGGGVLALIGVGLGKFIMNLISLSRDGTKLMASIQGVLGSLNKYLGMLQANVKAEVIKKLAVAVAILTVALIALTFIDPAKLGIALGVITGLFADLFTSMSLFFKFIDPVKIKELTGISVFLISMSVACLILAGSLMMLSKLSWNGIAKGLTGVIVLLGSLVGVSYLFSKLKIDTMLIRTSISLIAFSIALRMLIGPVMTLSKLSWNGLSKGLTGVIVLLGAMVGTSYLLGKFNLSAQIIKLSIILGLLAIALRLLVKPITDLGKLTWNELSKGLVGITVSLGALAGVSRIMSKVAPRMFFVALGLNSVASALNLLVKPIKAIGAMKFGDLLTGLLGITTMLTAMSIFTKSISKVNGLQFLTVSIGMTKIAGAMITVGAAIKLIGKIPFWDIVKGVGAIVVTLYTITAALKGIPNLSTAALQITIAAMALIILGSAIKKIGSLPLDTLVKGLLSIVVVMNVLARTLGSMSQGIVGAAAIFIVAPALIVLAEALNRIGSLPIGVLIKGLLGIAGVMTILSIALNSMSSGIVGAAAIFIVAPALIVMAEVLERIGELAIGTIIKGVLGLAGVMTVLVIALNAMSSGIGGALAIAIVAPALIVLAGALKLIGSIDKNTLIKGLLGLAGSMLVLSVALTAMQATIGGSIALGLAVLALIPLVTVLKGLGSLDLSTIGIALVAMAGSFTVLGLAGYFIGPLAPLILMLAGSITLLGIGALAAGAGVLAFATAMTALAAIGVAGMVSIMGMATVFAQGLPTLITLAVTALSKTLTMIFNTLFKLIVGTLNLILDAVVKIIPKIINALTILLSSAIKMVEKLLPSFGKLLTTLFTQIIKIIKDVSPKLAKAWVEIVTDLLEMANENIPAFIEAGKEFIINYIRGITEAYKDIAIAMVDLIIYIINSISEAIDTKMKDIYDACSKFVSSVMSAILYSINAQVKLFNDIGVAITEGMVNGIAYSAGHLYSSVGKIVKGAIKAAKEGLDSHSPSKEFEKIGKDVVNGLTEGIDGKSKDPVDSIKDVASNIIDSTRTELDCHSPSEVFAKIGEMIMGGLVKGTEKGGGGAIESIVKKIKEMIGAGLDTATSSDSYSAMRKQQNKSKKQIEKETAELAEANKTKEEKAAEASAKAAAKAEEERKKTEAANAEQRKKEAENQASEEETARRNRLNAIEAYIEEEKYYNRLSLEQELDIWKTRIKEFASNTEEYKKIAREIYRVQNEISDKSFEDSKKWITEKSESGELKLTTDNPNEDSQIKAWTRLRDKQQFGSDKYIEANKELARVEKEVYDAGYNFSKNWIENEKYYNKLSLPGELAAWKRINARYKPDSEEFKESAREIYRVEKELEKSDKDFHDKLIDVHENFINDQKALDDDYYNSVSDINDQLADDIDDLTKQYEDAVKSRADSIYQSYGLFERVEFNDQEQVRNSTGELLYWVDAAKLATTTAQTAYPVMQAINGKSLTDNLQTQVTSLKTWKESLDQLRRSGLSQELIDELEAMGPASTAQIQALNRMNKYELSEYDKLWQEKKSLSKSEATAELNEMRVDTINSITDLKANASTELDGVAQVWVNKTIALREANQKELTKITNDYTTAIGIAETDINEEIKNLITSVQNTFNTPEYGKIWKSLGSNITKGIKEGMTAEDASESSVDMLDTAVEKSNKTLGINSPSKVFAKMGKFSVLGFAKGISDNLSLVKDKSVKMAATAKDTLSQSLSNFEALVTGESRPTIRPVIDMTDVQKGLDTTFGQRQGLNTYDANRRAAIMAAESKSNSTTNSNTTNNTTNNTTADNRITLNVNYSVRNESDIRKTSAALNNTLHKFNRSRGVPVYDG